jgi:glyoxylase-like metal-dependent hydrolase (beta-lactamase superfamily II)
VFAVLGGYNTIFVAFEHFVLVLEAGGSSREAQSVIEQIKQVAPGKPIRYVVVTHWHFDHVSGIRPYIAEGATIVGPPSVSSVLETAVAARRTLNPDALSRNPQRLKFEPVHGRARTFSDGKRTLVVHDISPSPHSAEMLVAYLPKEKILFEADLLDIYVPGRAGPAGNGARDLARKIELMQLDVERIVPVHGQIGTIEDLRQSLARPSL